MAASERLFVALDLPAAARAALLEFQRAEEDPDVWRPVGDDALHVTLAFLGHRLAGESEAVAELVSRCARPVAGLALGRALVLPPRRGRVLAAAVDDAHGSLAELQERVGGELAAASLYAPEKRRFRPHATVARLRAGARPVRAPRTEGPEPVAFAGEAVTLYRSHLARGGARYEPLARVGIA